MEMYTVTTDWLELLFNVFMIIMPALIVLAGSTAFGKRLIAFVAGAYNEVRKLFDEPNDVAIKYIAKKTGRDPKEVSELIISHGDKVAALFKDAG